jgi:hypothetical protein
MAWPNFSFLIPATRLIQEPRQRQTNGRETWVQDRLCLYNGCRRGGSHMEQVELRILAREVEGQCGFAMEAAERLKLGIDARDEDQVWHAIQAFFVSAGIISRMLWAGQLGVRSRRVPPDRRYLREGLGVYDHSPVSSDNFRALYHHFDEPLESWGAVPDAAGSSESNTVAVDWLQEVDLDEFTGDVDPLIWAVMVGNEKYELLPIIGDIWRMRQQAAALGTNNR